MGHSASVPLTKHLLSRLIAAIVLSLLAPVSRAQVIFSDFGPNMSYSSTIYWCITGPSNPGCGGLHTRWIASPFTPVANSTLTRIDLAVDYGSGTNGAIIDLVNDVNGLPGTTVLESWTVMNLPFPLPVPVTSLNSTGGVTLQSGTQYWLVAKPLANDTLFSWLGDSVGLEGSVTSIDGGPWVPVTTAPGSPFSGPGTLTAFDVIGPPIAPSSFSCDPGATIVNVGLPSVTVPAKSSLKLGGSFQVVYGGLGLNFTMLPPSGSAACIAQSNVGSLNVSMQLGGVSVLEAQSTASATLSVFFPSSVGPLPSCNFASGITNGCILNGSFDPSANYVEWFTTGFTTTILGASPKVLSTGPLTFWVNLDALGLSPASNSMDAIVRGVEPYIHRQLITNLPFIAPYAVIQDPGSVRVLVVNRDGLTTGVLPSGIQTGDIPGSSYVPSKTNPAIALSSFEAGSYEVVLSGINTGPYQLDALVTNFSAPSSETAFSGTIAQSEVLGYTLSLLNAAGGPTSTMSPTVVLPGDLNGDGKVDCSDLAIVAASYGTRSGQAGFNAWADVDNDGVINILDLQFVVQRFGTGFTCQKVTIVSHNITFQGTLSDISNSLQLGLIDNAGITNALSAKINAASAAAARGDSATASNVLNAFKNQVSAQIGKHITGVAPQVLQEDADSLISQLP